MQKLIERVKAILLAPEGEWPIIAKEPDSARELLFGYVALLALIPTLAGFFGSWLIGGYISFLSGLLGALLGYLLVFLAVVIVATAMNALAPIFLAQRNFLNAIKVTVYSYTPVWLAGVFLLIPGLTYLTVIGLYGAYLLWLGLSGLMQAPRDKALPYAAAVLAVALVVAIVAEAVEIAVVGRTR